MQMVDLRTRDKKTLHSQLYLAIFNLLLFKKEQLIFFIAIVLSFAILRVLLLFTRYFKIKESSTPSFDVCVYK